MEDKELFRLTGLLDGYFEGKLLTRADAIKASDAIKYLMMACRKQREAAEDIADDFIDYVTNGVQNPAPFCANMRQECCERPGWCTGQSKECKGFFPKAARGKEKRRTSSE